MYQIPGPTYYIPEDFPLQRKRRGSDDGTLGGGECTFPRGAVGFRTQRVKCRETGFDVARPDVAPREPACYGLGAG